MDNVSFYTKWKKLDIFQFRWPYKNVSWFNKLHFLHWIFAFSNQLTTSAIIFIKHFDTEMAKSEEQKGIGAYILVVCTFAPIVCTHWMHIVIFFSSDIETDVGERKSLWILSTQRWIRFALFAESVIHRFFILYRKLAIKCLGRVSLKPHSVWTGTSTFYDGKFFLLFCSNRFYLDILHSGWSVHVKEVVATAAGAARASTSQQQANMNI